MQSHNVLIGARVRVLETDRRAELRGVLGTIEHRFGHPEYLALDVRLDDGQLELFWAHGLESAEEAAEVMHSNARELLRSALERLEKTRE